MAAARSLELLRDYVAIPSVNPMGRSDIPADIVGETRYAEHLHAQLRALQIDSELVGPADRRSVIAEVSVGNRADTGLVASHLDTVPVGGMEIDPFDPRIENGRLYGRGSCDTKGGMAALVAALERVLAGGTLRRNLILVGESDEELGSIGAREVLARFDTRPPDWVIATEPTSLRVVPDHKGIALARLVARGRACHSSAPERGHNAIFALARAALVLEDFGVKLRSRTHPTLGPATLSVGLIGGGQAPNIVPDEAWLVLDRRLLPGETTESVRHDLETVLSDAGIDDVHVEDCQVEKGALATSHEHASVRRCQRLLGEQGLATEPSSVAFGTDAGVFAERGWPGIVMGPGSIDRAHTSKEYVETDEVEAMEAFFVKLLETSD